MGSDLRHCVLTLVERKTGYAIIKKLRRATKHEVTRAATRAIRSHCRKFKTITFDNGTEFHDYALLEAALPGEGLLRHAVSLMGARQQRELQRPAAPVPAQGHLHAQRHAGAAAITSPTTSTTDQENDSDFDTPAALYHRN